MPPFRHLGWKHAPGSLCFNKRSGLHCVRFHFSSRDDIMEDFVPLPGWLAQAERERLEYYARHANPPAVADADDARSARHRWHRADAAGFYEANANYKKNAKQAARWGLKQQRWVNRARASYVRSKRAAKAALTVLVRTRSDARVASHYIALAIAEASEIKAVQEAAHAHARAIGEGLQILVRAELQSMWAQAILGAQMAAERVCLADSLEPRPGRLDADAQFRFWQDVSIEAFLFDWSVRSQEALL